MHRWLGACGWRYSFIAAIAAAFRCHVSTMALAGTMPTLTSSLPTHSSSGSAATRTQHAVEINWFLVCCADERKRPQGTPVKQSVPSNLEVGTQVTYVWFIHVHFELSFKQPHLGGYTMQWHHPLYYDYRTAPLPWKQLPWWQGCFDDAQMNSRANYALRTAPVHWEPKGYIKIIYH